MPYFRKKPIVIEAVQWFPNKKIEGVATGAKWAKDRGCINTLEGPMIVCPGDWIITGIAGEVYPCKPDIFSQTYEPVEYFAYSPEGNAVKV